MIELTEERRQEPSGLEPLAIDPQTKETYVLLRREAYERLKALLFLDEYDQGGPGVRGRFLTETVPDPRPSHGNGA